MGVWVSFRVFDFIPVIILSIPIQITCSFYYYCSVVQVEVRENVTSRNSFIVQDCFTYPGPFVFPYEGGENDSVKVCKELCWNFDGNCIESLSKMTIFTM